MLNQSEGMKIMITQTRTLVHRLVVSVFMLLAASSFANAQVQVAPRPSNQVSVIVNTIVTQDSVSKLYTYNYTVQSGATSQQEVWFIAIEFSGDLRPSIQNAKSPQGWSFGAHNDRQMVSWAATDVGPLPSNFVDDGSIVPSPFQIKPGQSLSGFSFQSPNPPASAITYIQGFTPLPVVVDSANSSAVADLTDQLKDFADDSIIGVAVAPQGNSATQPNSQKSTTGFISFLNFPDKGTWKSPVNISLKFSIDGETVNRSTFAASLNGVDVTTAFVPGMAPADLIGTFNVGSSPLQTGRNLLFVTVSGTLDGAQQSASERAVFYVNSPGDADLNGDGQINCADLAIVKASFGKKVGQTGFDPRADVNRDGIVNVIDLSMVGEQIPAGTVCQ
jgi:hypothetical protein